MSHSPMFSVIMPTCWRETVYFSVESVLGQTFEDFELLLVPDPMAESVRGLYAVPDDKRIRVLEDGSLNGTPYGNELRDHAIKKARGEWCVFVDDDDLALPCHLELIYRCLSEHAHAEKPPIMFTQAYKRDQVLGPKIVAGKFSGQCGIVPIDLARTALWSEEERREADFRWMRSMVLAAQAEDRKILLVAGVPLVVVNGAKIDRR